MVQLGSAASESGGDSAAGRWKHLEVPSLTCRVGCWLAGSGDLGEAVGRTAVQDWSVCPSRSGERGLPRSLAAGSWDEHLAAPSSVTYSRSDVASPPQPAAY